MGMKITKMLSLVVMPYMLMAQKVDHLVSFRDIKSDRYFRFNYDNDFFAATDEYYTQGYVIEFVSPGLKKNPINNLFFKPTKFSFRYGLALEHIGFTPKAYVPEEIQFGDRPFSSAIFLKSFSISTDTNLGIRFSQSLGIGIIGPAAFGKEMQVEIHNATGNKIPGGWNNQIQNDLVLNYRVDYEKQILRYRNLFSLQTNASLQLGTLFTNAYLGFNTVFGLFNSPFSESNRKSDFQLYFYTQPLVNAVGYDATLQGGLFNNNSPYTISSKDLERITAQFNYGLVLKTKTVYAEYTRTVLTREFTTGTAAKWGGIRVGFMY